MGHLGHRGPFESKNFKLTHYQGPKPETAPNWRTSVGMVQPGSGVIRIFGSNGTARVSTENLGGRLSAQSTTNSRARLVHRQI